MADFNSIRVDLSDMYKECEHRTSLHSRVHMGNEMDQEIVICPDDYAIVHAFANEAAVLLANAANYIQNASETGFEALTSKYSEGEINKFDELTLEELRTNEKQTGELLSKGAMDTLLFDIEEMEDKTLLKYTTTQTYIRSAIIEYILFKWFTVCKVYDAARDSFTEYEKFRDLLRFHSVTNIKRKKMGRPYRHF